jgi:hypothetical protein
MDDLCITVAILRIPMAMLDSVSWLKPAMMPRSGWHFAGHTPGGHSTNSALLGGMVADGITSAAVPERSWLRHALALAAMYGGRMPRSIEDGAKPPAGLSGVERPAFVMVVPIAHTEEAKALVYSRRVEGYRNHSGKGFL